MVLGSNQHIKETLLGKRALVGVNTKGRGKHGPQGIDACILKKKSSKIEILKKNVQGSQQNGSKVLC